MARILICDDHPFVLMGTKSYVQGLGHTVCEICSNGISAFNMIQQHRPDIALLDISMPGMNGIEVLKKVREEKLKTKVILLTMHNEMSVFNRAKALEVNGYILKDFGVETLGECIDSVMKGNVWVSKELSESLVFDKEQGQSTDLLNELSAAEKKIVALIAKQHTSRDIASMLFITEKTVENHRHRIMKKLDLPAEKNALLVWALKNFNVT
jgi:DNA-binding NarL/FixJ family response regulator